MRVGVPVEVGPVQDGPVSVRRRQSAGWRWCGSLLILAVFLWCPGCQFLQNEFFFLDTARPTTAAEVEGELAPSW